MASAYVVIPTAAFHRSLKRLSRKEPDVVDIFETMLVVLRADPHNVSRQHHIQELIGVEQGDGQWRLRSGVYRLRYDIEPGKVILHSINNRRDLYSA